MDQRASSTTQSSGQREMMFCHECHDEWYRDEHGIICPECQSEFTEIIEESNDPRDNAMFDDDEDGGDDEDAFMPSLREARANPQDPDLRHHNPWRDANDPDDSDISTMRLRNVSPGRFHVSATIHHRIVPAQLEPNGIGPTMFGGLTSFLANLIQGPRPPGQQNDRDGEDRDGSGPEPGPEREGGPRIHRFTYDAGARLHPRGADNPEPRLEPVDDLNNVIAGLLAALGEPPGGRPGGPGQIHILDGMAMNPLVGLFAAMSGGQHGDFVYSQEALDRIVSQLMEQTATSNAPGPASAEDIHSLPRKQVTAEMLGAEGRAECSICMDEVSIGDEVTELPCGHWFHHQCVAAWLSEHDTCPHCRKGITKTSDNAGNAAANATSSGAGPASSMPGTFGVSRGGTIETPPMVPGTVPPSASSDSNTNTSAARGQAHGSTNDASSSSGGGIGERHRSGWFGRYYNN